MLDDSLDLGVNTDMLLQPPIPYQVYTHETFQPQYNRDLERAVGWANIESAYISHDGVKRLAPIIEGLVRRKVRVCSFLQEPHDWHLRNDPLLNASRRTDLAKLAYCVDFLKSLGVHCTLRPRSHLKISVIDNRITWIGSLNMMSYTKFTDEEVYRWVDESWAQDTVRRRRFAEECEQCKEKGMLTANEMTIGLDPVAVGRQIEVLRMSLGMSQKDLADRLGISRDVLGDIENGRRFVKWDLLIKAYGELNRYVVALPPPALPVLARWIQLGNERHEPSSTFSNQLVVRPPHLSEKPPKF